MAKKTRETKSEPQVYVTVKLGKEEHSKLRTVASVLDRDIANLLTEIVRGPIDKLWREQIALLNEQVKGSK